MPRYDQPWERVRICGCAASLQVVDPETAFEIEPQLVARLGDSLSLLAGSPDDVQEKIRERALEESGLTESEVLGSLSARSIVALNSAQLIAQMVERLGQSVARREIDPKWLMEMFGALVIGRLKVGGSMIEDLEDWNRLGWRPRAKWHAMWSQIAQTFGPLWTRSPYQVRSKSKTYGVKPPPGVPIAAQWADALASQGRAASSVEILRGWTPLEVIRVVESSAYQAEIQRREMDANKKGR